MTPRKAITVLPKDSLLDMRKTSEIIYTIRDKNRKFRHVCSQLILMNNLLEEMEVRYSRAQTNNSKCYRYILRLKLCTLEGVRNQFYEYAYAKAEQLEKLQFELYSEHGITWNSALEKETDNEDEEESN